MLLSASFAVTGLPQAQAQPPVHVPFHCDGTLYLMQATADPNQGNRLGRVVFPPPGSSHGASLQPLSTAPFKWNGTGSTPPTA